MQHILWLIHTVFVNNLSFFLKYFYLLMEYLNNFVITLVATIIFMTAVEIIAPDNSMKKYIKFVLGLILISVMINPIIKFFTIPPFIFSYIF